MRVTVTLRDEHGNEVVTEDELFAEAYPGQIEDMVAGIKAGLSAHDVMAVYADPQPRELET